MRIGPDLRREQVAPDSAYLPTADPQRVCRQRRRECVGHLKKPAARPQQLETGLYDGSLSLQREPFNRQARDNGGQPLDMAGEILADSRRIALNHGCSRKVTAQHGREAGFLFDCDDALERTVRTRPRVRLPVPAPSSRTGPGLSSSTKRARASARWRPLGFAAAICSGFCSQRQKKTGASAAIRLSTLIAICGLF